jgi:hypothetical protein
MEYQVSPNRCRRSKLPLVEVREVLYVDFDRLWPSAPYHESPHYQPSLPGVRSLYIKFREGSGNRDPLQLLASWRLPGLRFLSVNHHHQRVWSPLEEFLRAFGPKLESLELIRPPASLVDIATIVGHCSSIQNLCIDYINPPTRPEPYPPLPPTPSLRRIQFTRDEDPCDVLKWTEEIYMQDRPSLQCVQFKDVSGTEFLAQLSDLDRLRWRAWGEKLLAEDIRMEDKNGELLCRAADPAKDLSYIRSGKDKYRWLVFKDHRLRENIWGS